MTIVQTPNAPLIVMAIAWLLARFSSGPVTPAAMAIFTAAGVIWSYEELRHGVNWFRRGLGAVVLILLVVGLARRLAW